MSTATASCRERFQRPARGESGAHAVVADDARGGENRGVMAGRRADDTADPRASPYAGREGETRLPDGRRLAYVEHGPEAGYPVLLEHGTPGSRLGLSFADAPARARGVRVICPDRPGIGRSDPAPRRTLLGWADDVAALMNALGIDSFGVLAWSSGAPHALACAARLVGRVSAVGLMAATGPLDRPEAFKGLDPLDRWLAVTSARRPRLAALVLRLQGAVARRAPGLALRALMSDLGEADRLRLAAIGRELVLTFGEPTRQGPYGVIDDYRRWIASWPFALNAVDAPVDVWQGDADTFVPMRHA